MSTCAKGHKLEAVHQEATNLDGVQQQFRDAPMRLINSQAAEFDAVLSSLLDKVFKVEL